MAEITITSDNFETEVLESPKTVLLDFWASWCMPCKMLAPVIGEIAEEYNGKITVGKINVDEQPKLASDFHVAGIPTVIVLKDGKIINRSVGYQPKENIEVMLPLK